MEIDRQRLEDWYRHGCVNTSSRLDFGRKMPFGKYKNVSVYVLIVKHPRYMNWVLENTGFRLSEDERWLKDTVDLALECARADNLIFGLRSQMGLGGVGNIENPHWVVE